MMPYFIQIVVDFVKSKTGNINRQAVLEDLPYFFLFGLLIAFVGYIILKLCL